MSQNQYVLQKNLSTTDQASFCHVYLCISATTADNNLACKYISLMFVVLLKQNDDNDIM